MAAVGELLVAVWGSMKSRRLRIGVFAKHRRTVAVKQDPLQAAL
jgi:hypothetical protein